MRSDWKGLAGRAAGLPVVAMAILLLQGASAGAGTAPEQGHDKAAKLGSASAAFERLKKLEGEWRGRGGRGLDEVIKLEVIANGTVVLERSAFANKPDQTMATAFQLDGDRLMLTHYCIAGNQPRMVAAHYEDGGRSVTFVFLDGTNLPSRDTGHMDKAVYRFIDDDHFTSRWTWYEKGQEQWTEEISYERKI